MCVLRKGGDGEEAKGGGWVPCDVMPGANYSKRGTKSFYVAKVVPKLIGLMILRVLECPWRPPPTPPPAHAILLAHEDPPTLDKFLLRAFLTLRHSRNSFGSDANDEQNWNTFYLGLGLGLELESEEPHYTTTCPISSKTHQISLSLGGRKGELSYVKYVCCPTERRKLIMKAFSVLYLIQSNMETWSL